MECYSSHDFLVLIFMLDQKGHVGDVDGLVPLLNGFDE
jgi:hypothetical protein